MRTTAPADFDVHAFYEGVYLFQRMELFPGIVTKGVKDVGETLDRLGVPRDLTGLRVLDIATWNGFFAFECAKRGAREVVALGPEEPDRTGFERTRALLELDNVRYVQGSVYDISEAELGRFDVVLFLGLIYHLRHPLLALDRAWAVCDGRFYLDTPYGDNIVRDKTISDEVRAAIQTDGKVVNHLPMLYFSEADETGDSHNWFIPNLKGIRALVSSAGFRVTLEGNDGGGWCWLAAEKGERRFVDGLEGYDPWVGRRHEQPRRTP